MGNNISDLIEQFILSAIEQEENLRISRNELANYFNCAPSQINYVLNSRFTLNRGFLVIILNNVSSISSSATEMLFTIPLR